MNYSDIKLSSLRYTFIERLSLLLRPTSPGKDWRSFADLVGFSTAEIKWLEEENDPVVTLIRKWEIGEAKYVEPTIEEVISALKELKRYDAIRDVEEIAVNFQDCNKEETDQNGDVSLEPKEPLPVTVHESYDVFISYAEDDIEFAKLLLKELEASPMNLSVCIDFKDFIPGCNSLHQITEVIERRCRKVIVVLSESYVKCEMCEFQAQAALALSPAAKKRLLIPIMYKKCQVPQILRFLYHLDYSDSGLREYFWPRLLKSLEKT